MHTGLVAAGAKIISCGNPANAAKANFVGTALTAAASAFFYLVVKNQEPLLRAANQILVGIDPD